MVKFPSADVGPGRVENGVYTHSPSWDSSTANRAADVSRHSTERSAHVPELGGVARDLSSQLGTSCFNFSGRKVTPLGWDMGQIGVFKHLGLVLRRGTIGHWVTWFMSWHHRALTMRGWCEVGAVDEPMA